VWDAVAEQPRDLGGARCVRLKDSTLREALDTPGVAFSIDARLEIAGLLATLGVPEAEIVAPARVTRDLEFARELHRSALPIVASGLVYANRPGYRAEAEAAAEHLDRIDLVMPLSEKRPPHAAGEKIADLLSALEACKQLPMDIGVGFPHATQVAEAFLTEIALAAGQAGAERITIYDTNGSTEPFRVHALITQLAERTPVPLLFHGHNDFGLAVANSWAATCAGAACLDVTINGLGDRAGNAALEPLVMLLAARGIETGVDPAALPQASRRVAELSGIPVSKLAPVVGEYAFDHKSPAHLSVPTEFEAFDPALVGGTRRIDHTS
jgi:isopropylmalate/homocitrate/citramalate synthase